MAERGPAATPGGVLPQELCERVARNAGLARRPQAVLPFRGRARRGGANGRSPGDAQSLFLGGATIQQPPYVFNSPTIVGEGRGRRPSSDRAAVARLGMLHCTIPRRRPQAVNAVARRRTGRPERTSAFLSGRCVASRSRSTFSRKVCKRSARRRPIFDMFVRERNLSKLRLWAPDVCARQIRDDMANFPRKDRTIETLPSGADRVMERAVTVIMPPGAITGSTKSFNGAPAVARHRALGSLRDLQDPQRRGAARPDARQRGQRSHQLPRHAARDDRHPRRGWRAGDHRHRRLGERSQGQADRDAAARRASTASSRPRRRSSSRTSPRTRCSSGPRA